MREDLKNKYITSKRFKIYNDFDKYNKNLKISKHLYIPLSILEVSLRNSINNLFEKLYGAGWLVNEAQFLKHKEIEKIQKAKDRITDDGGEISKDKLVSELTFGFWTALFQSVYDNKMRFSNLKNIFPNLPPRTQQEITRNILSTKLNHIRKFRNRIFHHENIIKDEFNDIENNVYEILEFFDNELAQYTRDLNNE